MGESEAIDVKAPVADENPAAKAAPKKDKKKEKKQVLPVVVAPHVSGRVLHIEVGASGIEFAIKGKKGKTEVFSLSGMDAIAIPAAASLLAGLVSSKGKLRVEFTETGENNRTVKKIRVHS